MVNSNYRQCNSNYRKILNIKIAVKNDTCLHEWYPLSDFVVVRICREWTRNGHEIYFLKNSCILLGIPD